jgi:hypothetical protein
LVGYSALHHPLHQTMTSARAERPLMSPPSSGISELWPMRGNVLDDLVMSLKAIFKPPRVVGVGRTASKP